MKVQTRSPRLSSHIMLATAMCALTLAGCSSSTHYTAASPTNSDTNHGEVTADPLPLSPAPSTSHSPSTISLSPSPSDLPSATKSSISTQPQPSTTKTTTRVPAITAAGQSSKEKSFAEGVVRLTNAERAKKAQQTGKPCPPLTINAALTKAAQGHSADMAARKYFAHATKAPSPWDGVTGTFGRIKYFGYMFGAAENIAMGQASPESVMGTWMNSAGHRANILNCGLNEIGVGYQDGPGSSNDWYWTQDFGARP